MNTLDNQEIKKFNLTEDDWWNPKGKMQVLHKFNPPRVKYITEQINTHIEKPTAAKSLIDIGCGGGLLTESLAKSVFNIHAVGIDANENCINVAKSHSQKNSVNNVDYIHTSLDDLSDFHSGKYDIVLAMEIIEHVKNPELFVEQLYNLMKPGGIIIISTITRNLYSLLTAKFAAEYILRWLPKGTHEFNKFIKPCELKVMLEKNRIQVKDLVGVNFNLLSKNWLISKSLKANYICCAQLSSKV